MAVTAIGYATSSAAQLLPGGRGLPQLPAGQILQILPATINHAVPGVTTALGNAVASTNTVVRDVVGRPLDIRDATVTINNTRVVRSEVLIIAPTAADLAAARGRDFRLLRQESFGSLGLSTAVLRAPHGMDTATALATLRQADPNGHFDYNHIYNPSGDGSALPPATDAGAGIADVADVGMIDAGVDHHHAAFRHVRIESTCFAGHRSGPVTTHGTAVASLLVGQDRDFHGALRGTALFAADVYCGDATGGSAEDIVRALAWLAQNRIAVVNISLSGPPDDLLAAATAAFIKQGHVLVAAVGNDGPAAPERYPAAYPGVVGVTSVDAAHQIELDAGRGNDVAFAALGVDVRAAALQGGYAPVTGTSFAAPTVTAHFAMLVPVPDPAVVARAWTILEQQTVDLGAPGRDPVFGYGYLGKSSEVAISKCRRAASVGECTGLRAAM